MLRIALISNELPPYRIPFFEALARQPGVALRVIFCSRKEPNRQWALPHLEFDHLFLKERITASSGRFIHNNTDVLPALQRFAPDVVVTGGFNPTHLYAFAYARMGRIAHVPWTDGTDISEEGLHPLHRFVRRAVYRRSEAFVASSDGGLRLYRNYDVAPEHCFKSCLCIDNASFSAPKGAAPRRIDMLFCGRLEELKNPLFALEVAVRTAERLRRRVSIRFVGAGAEEQRLKDAAADHAGLVDVRFTGFTPHSDLPTIYHDARLFLFPSRVEPWGVVVNEACAAGLPVLASPYAGVSGELVRDGVNGFVCQLDADLWSNRAASLLGELDHWQAFSERSAALVADYSYDNAAAGLIQACQHAFARRGESRVLPKAA